MIKLSIGVKLSIPFLIHFAIVIPLTYNGYLNSLEFLGLNFSVAATLTFISVILNTIYVTWLGVALGHYVDLKEIGSWAVVTGATDGIGWAYCQELAKKGINVVLMSRTLERLERCAATLESEFGIMTKIIQVDFSGDIDVYDKVDLFLQGMEIGTLINNVGISYSRPTQFHELPDSKKFIHDMINLNSLAVTMMTRAVLPGMLDRGKGVIVNVGSLASLYHAPYYSLYGASKAFMEKFTANLAREYKNTGIIFQYQCPGFVCTKMSKIKKPSFIFPSAEQYAKWGIHSIGLQENTAVWIPHRVAVLGLKTLRILIPKTLDESLVMGAKAFWLFAKKRELEKLQIVYSPKIC